VASDVLARSCTGCYALEILLSESQIMPQSVRREQRAITIRSDHAHARLAQLLRSGKSQVAIIEEALDRMPLPVESDQAARRARIDVILAQTHSLSGMSMAEFDAETYDENGLPR
jgi:hypothetical protein